MGLIRDDIGSVAGRALAELMSASQNGGRCCSPALVAD